jgi:hypothetical protein
MSGGTILQSSILGRLVRWIVCGMQCASDFFAASTSAVNPSPALLQLLHRNRNAIVNGNYSSPIFPPSHRPLTNPRRFESRCRLSGAPPLPPPLTPPNPSPTPRPHRLKSPRHNIRRSQKMCSKAEDPAATTLPTVIASSSCGHCKQLRHAHPF